MQTGMALAREIETLNVPPGRAGLLVAGPDGLRRQVWAGGEARGSCTRIYLAPAAARQSAAPPGARAGHPRGLPTRHPRPRRPHRPRGDPQDRRGASPGLPGDHLPGGATARRDARRAAGAGHRPDDGLSHEEDGLRITAVAARTSSWIATRPSATRTSHTSSRPMEWALFHAGDTLRYEGQRPGWPAGSSTWHSTHQRPGRRALCPELHREHDLPGGGGHGRQPPAAPHRPRPL